VGKVDLVISDIDGVLTDNRVWYAGNGIRMWAFNQGDLEGSKQLMEAGIEVALLSGAYTHAFADRAEFMKVRYWNAYNKLSKFVEVYGEDRLERTAFIGNDSIDIPLLSKVELSGCPRDAHSNVGYEVKARFGYVCDKGGGYGAFREFAEHILLTT
jgi:3-deoxy-D-manno-octulosonate 8-phosphate phosphatase (KDO 8-P phosphatase)